MDLTVEPSRLSMTSQILLGSLLLINLILLLYLLFAEPSSVREVPRTPEYPAEQRLTLISELEPSERVPRQVEEERAFTRRAAESEPLHCRAWGPFANTQGLEPVRSKVTEIDPAARVVSFEVEAPPDYLVFLSSDNNLDNARRILRELESQGIEAYVIAGGEFINSVSAGVFSNRAGAERLVDALDDLGYAPVLQPLERTQQVTYLLARVPEGFQLPEAESVPCGAIAQLEEFL